jgi:hypothetical protein
MAKGQQKDPELIEASVAVFIGRTAISSPSGLN